MDWNEQLINAVRDGIREGVKSKLGGYGSPLDKLLNDVLAKHDASFRSLLDESITSAVAAEEFREEVRKGLRHKLATLLVQRFGGCDGPGWVEYLRFDVNVRWTSKQETATQFARESDADGAMRFMRRIQGDDLRIEQLPGARVR